MYIASGSSGRRSFRRARRWPDMGRTVRFFGNPRTVHGSPAGRNAHQPRLQPFVLFCGDSSAGTGREVPRLQARQNQEGAVSVRLFIGNLPYAASEPELREHLSSVGEPTQIVLPVDRETGRPRGFAFVDYADRAVAEAAISRFDQQPFKGRPLAVSEARPREERPAGAPRPGGFAPGRGPAALPVAPVDSARRGPADGRRDRLTRARHRVPATGISDRMRRRRTSASRRARIRPRPEGPDQRAAGQPLVRERRGLAQREGRRRRHRRHRDERQRRRCRQRRRRR